MADRHYQDFHDGPHSFGYRTDYGSGGSWGWILLGVALVVGITALLFTAQLNQTPVEHPGGAGAPPVATSPQSGEAPLAPGIVDPDGAQPYPYAPATGATPQGQ